MLIGWTLNEIDKKCLKNVMMIKNKNGNLFKIKNINKGSIIVFDSFNNIDIIFENEYKNFIVYRSHL